MKNFKFFLTESTRSQTIDVQKAIELARTDFSDAMKLVEPQVIRGIFPNNESYYHVDPSKHTRTSANTSNEYTWLTDHSKHWAKYPNRSQSLICALKEDLSTAESFGAVHLVIPKNGAKFGVCSAHDFWFSFNSLNSLEHVDNMDEFNVFIKNALIFLTQTEPQDEIFTVWGPKYRDAKTFFKVLAVAEKNIKLEEIKSRLTGHLKKNLEPVLSGQYSLSEYFESIIDPSKNGFNVAKYSELDQFKKREVWTDSECILINIDKVAPGEVPRSYRVQEAFETFRKLVLDK